MRIAVIGTGKMGRGFAQALAPTHEVVVGSRDPARATATVSKTGAAGGATYADAAANADVVILTVPWQAITETLGHLGDLQGTVVIDMSYPYNKRNVLDGGSDPRRRPVPPITRRSRPPAPSSRSAPTTTSPGPTARSSSYRPAWG